jgi:hypothetical protein
MRCKYQKLLLAISSFLCILLINLASRVEKDKMRKDANVLGSIQEVKKTNPTFTEHKFIWYVIAPGGSSSSSGSHTMKFTSVGQVFTDKAQSPNYTIYSGYISTPAPWPVDVKEEEEKDQLPYSFQLLQNYPNPFNPETQIEYTLSKDSEVKLIIYNIMGQKVKTLVDQNQTAGHKRVHWDGTDDKGKDVASGIFFYRIEDQAKYGEQKYTKAQKMLLLK